MLNLYPSNYATNERHSAVSLIKLSNICKSYAGRTILKNLNFEIKEGDFFSIIGRSGAGKSTLLNIMALFEKPESGLYYFKDEIIPSKERAIAKLRNRNFGFIFQSFNLLSGQSVLQNIAMPLQYAEKKNQIARLPRISQLVDKLGIEKLQDEYVDNLSGGERQRVAIARALINNPSIVFADEPTGSLDFVSRNSVLKLLKELNASMNIAIVLVTHDPYVAQASNRIFELKEERLYDITSIANSYLTEVDSE